MMKHTITRLGMKRYINILYVTISLFVLPAQNSAQVTQEKRITATVLKKDTCCQIVFFNVSQDTLYLFDSYICNDFYKSKWLHRYSRNRNLLKLSFLPLVPFLSVHYTDKLIIGERRLINKWQVLYHFTPIPPRGKIRVNLPLEVFKTYDYVIDIDMKQLSIFQDDIKFKRRRIKKLTDIAIEFAFYDQINLLNSESFYKNEFKSGEQALNYNILEIFYHIED